MYLRDILSALVRRWYILLVGLVIIVGVGFGALKVVPTQYQASGQMLLLLSTEASDKPTNPYLNVQPGLTTTAGLIAGSMMTRDTQLALAADGFSIDYAVALNPGSGPLIVITVSDTDPARALGTRDELMRRLDAELTRIQVEEDVPESQLIHSRADNLPSEAEALPGSKIRALAIIGGVGLILLAILTFTVDRVLSARSANRDRRIQQNHAASDEPAEQNKPTGRVIGGYGGKNSRRSASPSGEVAIPDTNVQVRESSSTTKDSTSTLASSGSVAHLPADPRRRAASRMGLRSSTSSTSGGSRPK